MFVAPECSCHQMARLVLLNLLGVSLRLSLNALAGTILPVSFFKLHKVPGDACGCSNDYACADPICGIHGRFPNAFTSV